MLFQFFLYRNNVPIEIEIDCDEEEILPGAYNDYWCASTMMYFKQS